MNKGNNRNKSRIISDLRLFLFQVLQASLQVVVGLWFGFEIGVDLPDLFAYDVGDIPQRLLYGILSDVPLETGYVIREVICWRKVACNISRGERLRC